MNLEGNHSSSSYKMLVIFPAAQIPVSYAVWAYEYFLGWQCSPMNQIALYMGELKSLIYWGLFPTAANEYDPKL